MKVKAIVLEILGRKGTTGDIKMVKINLLDTSIISQKTHVIPMFGSVRKGEKYVIDTDTIRYKL